MLFRPPIPFSYTVLSKAIPKIIAVSHPRHSLNSNVPVSASVTLFTVVARAAAVVMTDFRSRNASASTGAG